MDPDQPFPPPSKADNPHGQTASIDVRFFTSDCDLFGCGAMTGKQDGFEERNDSARGTWLLG
jgi:hypothetical protein